MVQCVSCAGGRQGTEESGSHKNRCNNQSTAETTSTKKDMRKTRKGTCRYKPVAGCFVFFGSTVSGRHENFQEKKKVERKKKARVIKGKGKRTTEEKMGNLREGTGTTLAKAFFTKQNKTKHPMLSHAIPCYAVPSHAIPCYPMPSHAIPCYPMLSHSIPCHPMPSHAIPCHSRLSHAIIPCHPMLSHSIPCYPMLSRAIPCYPMLSHAIPCYPMLSHAIPWQGKEESGSHKNRCNNQSTAKTTSTRRTREKPEKVPAGTSQWQVVLFSLAVQVQEDVKIFGERKKKRGGGARVIQG